MQWLKVIHHRHILFRLTKVYSSTVVSIYLGLAAESQLSHRGQQLPLSLAVTCSHSLDSLGKCHISAFQKTRFETDPARLVASRLVSTAATKETLRPPLGASHLGISLDFADSGGSRRVIMAA
ncbi:hypothetical protein TWF751_001042 [Orbilia oligospora]|nr:hypothetical protein TWF751_001042 [Orbilia oligospora]